MLKTTAKVMIILKSEQSMAVFFAADNHKKAHKKADTLVDVRLQVWCVM